MDEIEQIRKDFPMIGNNENVIYFDNAATSLKPKCVIDKIVEYYENYSVNSGRGSYDISLLLDDKIESCRRHVSNFINASSKNEIVFTSGTTEGLNLVVKGYLENQLQEGDIILTTKAEHASLLLPLMSVCKNKKAIIKYVSLNKNGTINLEHLKDSMSEKVKAVVISHISNVMGSINPIKEISDIVHKYSAVVIVDGAQSAPHIKIDVRDLDCDVFTFSAHKMCGPTGLGILYGKMDVLNKMQPLIVGGGNNVNYFSDGQYFLKNAPYKFESGTLPLAQIIAFDTSLTYLEKIGINIISEYETELKDYLISRLKILKNIKVYNPEANTCLLTFNIKGVYGSDAGKWFNANGIAVRTGQHCTRLLIDEFQTDSTIRVSLYFYNTFEEIDKFIEVCRSATRDNIYNLIFNNSKENKNV